VQLSANEYASDKSERVYRAKVETVAAWLGNQMKSWDGR